MSRSERPKPVVMPPAPPGELSPGEVRKTRAVAESLARLGEAASPAAVAADVRAEAGVHIGAGEAGAIQTELIDRAEAPPGPDQPPPQQTRTDRAGDSPRGPSDTRTARRTAMLVRDV